jgi:hypothetical protein
MTRIIKALSQGQIMKLDTVTAELPGLKKPPMGNAERSRLKRERLAAEGKKQISVTVSLEVIEAMKKHIEFRDMSLGDAAEKALRDRFLRKR